MLVVSVMISPPGVFCESYCSDRSGSCMWLWREIKITPQPGVYWVKDAHKGRGCGERGGLKKRLMIAAEMQL